ncbi:DoxX family protein [Streptomyces griseoruber]|uniref:DoxX family protein n=1 Tax=Streptomyces griseoruber TaxID=1943 RepID=UPI003787C2DE
MSPERSVNILLWVVQSLLAVAFLAVGAMKIFRNRTELAATFGWVEQFSDPSVKAIGALDALVGLGLVLPGVTNIAPALVPWAALGGIALAGGGSVVHLRRSETQLAAVNVVYIALLALVAWGRFGPYAF